MAKNPGAKKSAKPKDPTLQTLHVHNVPADLLGRINARVALRSHDRDQWIIKLLDAKTAKLKPLQDELRRDDEAEEPPKA
jgi:hypothetical protein